MQRLEVSGAVQLIYRSLGLKGLIDLIYSCRISEPVRSFISSRKCPFQKVKFYVLLGHMWPTGQSIKVTGLAPAH